MDRVSINILIGGEAGQGLVTIGSVLGKALVRKGYHLHVTQAYESRIRGGHNAFALRTGNYPAESPIEKINILIALDDASLSLYKDNLAVKAIILSDDKRKDFPLEQSYRHLRVPIDELAKDTYPNTVMLGALGALLGLEQKDLLESLVHSLGKKPPEIIENNETALKRAYAWILKESFEPLKLPAPPLPDHTNLMLNGNQALAFGAMAAGVKFCAFYPMSPSTSIPLTLAAAAKNMGIIVEQAEDEIAAVNMVIGAFYAGARAITATSGGGFSLMAEAISLAGMTETPLVIAVAMRPGPATGLPTRTEQADLNAAVYFGHGEFARAIFAPGSLQECFELMRHAVLLAEKSQGPVFVLTDQYLADSYRNVQPFDPAPPPALLGLQSKEAYADPEYKRYALAADGLSPALLPGLGKALVTCDSDEHTEDGRITEDLQLRVKMQNKRLAKIKLLMKEIIPPTFTGPASPDILLISWGSTIGAVKEAAEMLTQEGHKVCVGHFSQVYPLDPNTFLPQFESASLTVVVESNSRGQFSRLIRSEVGFSVHKQVLRYDGLPMTAEYIVKQLADR